MSKVPEFGVWNDPTAEEVRFTGNFDMLRKVRHDRSSKNRIPIQKKIDTNSHHKASATNSDIGERMRNVKSPVGYDIGEIWESLPKSVKSNPENVVPQTRQSRRPPPASIDRRRHDLSPAKHQKVLTSPDDPKGRHERPRTGTSSGSTSALGYLSPENQHHRHPSSSSDSSRRDLLSSREEELMAKKGSTAPKFGKWNVDPNFTQEYTKEFGAVRNQKEKSVVEPSSVPTPQIQSYSMDTPQQKKHKGTKVKCLDCLFPRVKTH